MKEYGFEQIATALSTLIDQKLRAVEPQTMDLLRSALLREDNDYAKWAIDTIVKNGEKAKEQNCYACQDCGVAIIFAFLGRDAKLTCSLECAINEGVRRGYKDARKSVACPLTRLNTGDNTPAVIYTEIVEGDGLTLSYLAKGAGSENMSQVYMLTPSKGEDGVVKAVVDCVTTAGANPCPPLVLGVGIGGTMDKACVLSKKALLRETGTPSKDERVAFLERRILDAVNETGIGAQGLGGKTTALAVHIETFPTHIGMLPVAVTVQCHSVRHGSVTL